ncbi:cyclic nucleotide-binding domain protein (macronuclear) [Tetrahymena thermophila SB210]|uniref:Cyclic nucleotide-binding domain protein n=1 Tax=Tetrahymena thermophila (strain SB210) TaxID=312017 RepID=I7MHB8_TETTS|nr:cyclic nucleotide-binding domain protein [Tetrahymena thermophila SB210]EAS02811.2 cyclic nucleotide-binding domain protein [Tetrahymena thermophila SB210]|eukprot:XP_001023056.2 cyclic nucleotide-binding domain protein [Tetrahymena thermophila SB210]
MNDKNIKITSSSQMPSQTSLYQTLHESQNISSPSLSSISKIKQNSKQSDQDSSINLYEEQNQQLHQRKSIFSNNLYTARKYSDVNLQQQSDDFNRKRCQTVGSQLQKNQAIMIRRDSQQSKQQNDLITIDYEDSNSDSSGSDYDGEKQMNQNNQDEQNQQNKRQSDQSSLKSQDQKRFQLGIENENKKAKHQQLLQSTIQDNQNQKSNIDFKEKKNRQRKISQATANQIFNSQNIDIKDSEHCELVIQILNKKKAKTKQEKQFILNILKCCSIFQKNKNLISDNASSLNITEWFSYQYMPKNTIVFNQGEYGNTYYIVLQGQVFCMIPDPDYNNTKEKYLNDQLNKRKQYFTTNPYNKNFRVSEVINNQANFESDQSSKKTEKEQIQLLIECFPTLKLVHTFNSGESFGDIALITNERRTATLICKEDTHFLTLTKEGYEQIIGVYETRILDETIKFLRSFHYFKNIVRSRLLQILCWMKEQIYFKKNIIYKQGEISNSVIFIRSGEIEIFQDHEINENQEAQEQSDSPSSKQVSKENKILQLNLSLMKKVNKQKTKRLQLLILGSNQYFGQIELLNNIQKRQQSALCISQTAHVYILPKNKFYDMIKMNHGSIQIIRKEEQMRGDWIQNRLNQVQQTYNIQLQKNNNSNNDNNNSNNNNNGSDRNAIEESQSPSSSKSSNNYITQQTSSKGNSFYCSSDDIVVQSKFQQFLESDNVVEKNNSVSSQRKRQFYAQTRNKNLNKTNIFQNTQNKNIQKFNTIYSQEPDEVSKFTSSKDSFQYEESSEANINKKNNNYKTQYSFGLNQNQPDSSIKPKPFLSPKNQSQFDSNQISKNIQFTQIQTETQYGVNFQDQNQQKSKQELQINFLSRQNSPKEIKIEQNGYFQNTFQAEDPNIIQKTFNSSNSNQARYNIQNRNLFFYIPQNKQSLIQNGNSPISSVVSVNDNVNPYNSIHLSYLKKIHQGLLAKKDNLNQLQQYQFFSTFGQNQTNAQNSSPEKTSNTNSFHMLFLEIDKQKHQQAFRQTSKKNVQNNSNKSNFQSKIKLQIPKDNKDFKIHQSQLILNKFNKNVQVLKKQQEISNSSLVYIPSQQQQKQQQQQQQNLMFQTYVSSSNKLSQQNLNNSIFNNQNQIKKTAQDLSNTSFSVNQQPHNVISFMRNFSQDSLLSQNHRVFQEYLNVKDQIQKKESFDKFIDQGGAGKSLKNKQFNNAGMNQSQVQNNNVSLNKSQQNRDSNDNINFSQILQTNHIQINNKALNSSLNNKLETKYNIQIAFPQLEKKNKSCDKFKKPQLALYNLINSSKDQSFYLNSNSQFDKNQSYLNQKQLNTFNQHLESSADKTQNAFQTTNQNIKDFGKYAKNLFSSQVNLKTNSEQLDQITTQKHQSENTEEAKFDSSYLQNKEYLLKHE